jgi:hypothetical protein
MPNFFKFRRCSKVLTWFSLTSLQTYNTSCHVYGLCGAFYSSSSDLDGADFVQRNVCQLHVEYSTRYSEGLYVGSLFRFTATVAERKKFLLPWGFSLSNDLRSIIAPGLLLVYYYRNLSE